MPKVFSSADVANARDFRFRMEGLSYNREGDEFILSGVNLIDPDVHSIIEGLVSQGFEVEDVDRAVERLAISLQSSTLARIFAKRMRRTG
jgi:hypothetical protein